MHPADAPLYFLTTTPVKSAPELVSASDANGNTPAPLQRVLKIRRDYNSWVGSETMEDYALRFTPQRFRTWSEWRVANTAFGAAPFLILEAVGATLLVKYGFANAFWAILATGLIISMAGLPISIYTARYGLDMDLLKRGVGFGCIGSILMSLIYALFTFIFSRWKLLRLLILWSWPWPWALRRTGATFFVRWWSFHWLRTGCRARAACKCGRSRCGW